METHWGSKAQSVAHILKQWNIAADSTVFIDDSPAELSEVRQAFPQLECLQFPHGNDQAIYQLLGRLRELFGKSTISEEDGSRIESMRNRRIEVERDPTDLLGCLQGQLDFECSKYPPDPRALELINKTNQFHLNGTRYTGGAWLSYLEQPETILLVVSYRDRFGSLGRIAVITGQLQGDTLHVENWAMSCRAFARGIEHRCLVELARRFTVKEIAFKFVPTYRNGPLQQFFSKLLGTTPIGFFVLSKDLALRCLESGDRTEHYREGEPLTSSTVLPSSV
jgi:FkbH-like protein